MADEQESGSVGQDAFSEEILAWMAAGDALSTPAADGVGDDQDVEEEEERLARVPAVAAWGAALASRVAPLTARGAAVVAPLTARGAALVGRGAAVAARVMHLGVGALASWWEALPVPRRRTAIATAVGGLLLLGGLAVSQASSPRRPVAAAVGQVLPGRPVAEPARTTLPMALATNERPAQRTVVARSSSHPAHPARAKSNARSVRKPSVAAVPNRR